MTKNKDVKNRLLSSALTLLMCISMLIGSTFAWFTDSVTSDRNVIKSGTIKAKLEYSVLVDGEWTPYAEVTDQTDIFGYDKWEPGYVTVAKFRITNIGTLSLKYQLVADIYEEIPGVNMAGESFLLSDYMYADIVDENVSKDEILASTTGNLLKAPANGDLVIDTLSLEVNATKELTVAVWMPTTVGGEVNHNGTAPSLGLNIKLVATQLGADNF